MKTYEFTYVLIGKGETESEALVDALECLLSDPGDPTSSEMIEDDEDEELK